MTLPASPEARESYEPSFFAPLFAIEDRHFWFRSRNRIIDGLVRQLTAAKPDGFRVLEVGCGTGNVLQHLVRSCGRGRVYGMDLFGEGLHYARQRTPGILLQADVHMPPFSVQFDVIGLFDVLEHIEDDVNVLLTLRQMLAPGGSLLLTVPAHQSLWSYFDEAGRHVRRYEVNELTAKLRAAGFAVTYATEFMSVIYPIVWLQRKLAGLRRSQRQHADQMAEHDLTIVPVVNEALDLLCRFEARAVARRRALPIGTSILTVATA